LELKAAKRNPMRPEKSLPSGNAQSFPGKDLLGTGKGLFPERKLNPLGEKTFRPGGEVIPAENCPLTPGEKSLDRGLESKKAGKALSSQ
jgi:hypothetical protein